MKFLPLMYAVCLGASCAASAQQNRFVEIKGDYSTLTFDLDTVQFTSPGKFTIMSTEIDDPDVMKFELNALRTFQQYCARPDGKYPAPTELLQLGPPDDLPMEEIKVSSGKVQWKYPYRRIPHIGWFYCQEEYGEKYNSIANGFRQKEIYDCKRGLRGLADDGWVGIAPVRPRSYGESHYRTVCRAVMHEEPYLPQ